MKKSLVLNVLQGPEKEKQWQAVAAASDVRKDALEAAEKAVQLAK